MSTEKLCHVRLAPIGVDIAAEKGAALKDLLFEHGVEFPCGGAGRCRGCRVRVLDGALTLNAAQTGRLTQDEVASGWRMACQCRVMQDVTIELGQWQAAILADDAAFPFTAQPGLGVAVDLGTTTVVAQLLDLGRGQVLAVKSALNPQARHGGDVMSRIGYAANGDGAGVLKTVVRACVGRLIAGLLKADNVQAPAGIRRVVIVGNTAMHHLFSGIDIEPLTHYPFQPVIDGLQSIPRDQLDWPIAEDASVEFLPCLGGFVGSDIFAGIVATGLDTKSRLSCLIDLGTNGEIVVGNKERILCASTAAGPAFEGARIAMGMRAATGAIWKVEARDGQYECSVLGGDRARGICGSGLVDAAAVSLDLGAMTASGRLRERGADLALRDGVCLTQTDIRELQLAKGAIATGIKLLVSRWGAGLGDVEAVSLAGAFGNYINRRSARRIGLIPFDSDRVEAAGNTALLGAKILLSTQFGNERYRDILARSEHVSLSADPQFHETYVEEMAFPGH